MLNAQLYYITKDFEEEYYGYSGVVGYSWELCGT